MRKPKVEKRHFMKKDKMNEKYFSEKRKWFINKNGSSDNKWFGEGGEKVIVVVVVVNWIQNEKKLTDNLLMIAYGISKIGANSKTKGRVEKSNNSSATCVECLANGVNSTKYVARHAISIYISTHTPLSWLMESVTFVLKPWKLVDTVAC